MLKGISPLLSPELLLILHQMGHGDELVLADAHFPGHALGQRVLRADGLGIVALLDGILPLIELDVYAPDPLVMMAPVKGDTADPAVKRSYAEVIARHASAAPALAEVERFAFYERAKSAFAIVVTGEQAKYGNLIIKKGVIVPSA